MFHDRWNAGACRLAMLILHRCRRIAAVAAWLLACLAAARAPAAEVAVGANPGLAPRMEALLAEQGLVGASWMVLGDDGKVVTGAAGRRQGGTGEALGAGDRMHAGSVAKTMLATGILRLVTEGRLDLDAPLSTLLPEIVLDNPWQASAPVRLRHLLDHTSGLEDAAFRHVFTGAVTLDSPLAQAFRGRAVVRTRPGSEASYSNLGYTLAAMAVERAVGERYETYLDRTLLRPLGMHASSFAHGEGGAGLPPLAMGHLDRGEPQPYLPSYLRPAGQFVTTPRDMALFAAFLMGDGRLAGREFIRTDLLRAMGRPRDTTAAKAGLQVGYALGMRLRDRHGRVGLCHGGNGIGVRAMLCLFPDEGKAFFVGINADSETADYERFNALLADALAVPKRVPAPSAMAAPAAAWDGWYVRLPARMPAFVYLDYLFNPVALEAREGHVRLLPLLGKETLLAPVGGRLYRAPDRVTASHALVADSAGLAWADGTGTWRRVSLWSLALLWVSLACGLGAVLYVLVAGSVRLWNVGRGFLADALAPAWLALLGLPLAGVGVGLSWQTMGEIGAATVLLAALTAALPLAALYGLATARKDPSRLRRRRDWVALAGLLQWCLVLAAWGLLPFRIWA